MRAIKNKPFNLKIKRSFIRLHVVIVYKHPKLCNLYLCLNPPSASHRSRQQQKVTDNPRDPRYYDPF